MPRALKRPFMITWSISVVEINADSSFTSRPPTFVCACVFHPKRYLRTTMNMATAAIVLVFLQSLVLVSAGWNSPFSILDTSIGGTLAAKRIQNSATGEYLGSADHFIFCRLWIVRYLVIFHSHTCRWVCRDNCGLWWSCGRPCPEVLFHCMERWGRFSSLMTTMPLLYKRTRGGRGCFYCPGPTELHM